MSSIIAYRNLVSNATLSLTVGTPVAGDYGIDNLKARQLAKVWRGKRDGGSPQIQIKVDLGAAFDIRMIGFIRTNLDLAGAPGFWPGDFRVTHSLDDVTYSSGLLANNSTFDRAPIDIPSTSYYFFAAPVSARYLKIEPSWYIVGSTYEAGLLWISDLIEVDKGTDQGWGHDVDDSGTLDSSVGKQYYEGKNQRSRVIDLSFPELRSIQAYGFDENAGEALAVPSFQDMSLHVGKTGAVIVIPRDDSALWIKRTGIYGHLRAPLKIQHRTGPLYSASLTVVEER